MARGRKRISAYDKYVKEFNKITNKDTWQDNTMMSRTEFEFYSEGITNYSREDLVKDVISRQRFGYSLNESRGRKDFYQSELKRQGVKWKDVKNMTHAQFVEAYGDRISEIYQSFKDSGYAYRDIQLLISQYIFGSE